MIQPTDSADLVLDRLLSEARQVVFKKKSESSAIWDLVHRKPGGSAVYASCRRALIACVIAIREQRDADDAIAPIKKLLSDMAAVDRGSNRLMAAKRSDAPALVRKSYPVVDDTWTIVILSYGRNGGCFGCGANDLSVLSVHHLFGRRNQEKLSGRKLRRWLIQNNLPHGYMVVCENCHRKMHRSET